MKKSDTHIYEMREYVNGDMCIKYYVDDCALFIERPIDDKRKQSLYLDSKGIDFLLSVIKETRI